jgi:hypothetical protein
MYHVRGDVAWINNAAQRPALDPLSGALAGIGLVTWGFWARQRREAAWWRPAASSAVMLWPSAMALAYPMENPSFTRASGTLPGIFFLAALPAGWMLWRASRAPWAARGVSLGSPAAALGLVALVAAVYPWNRDNYFTAYRVSYERNWRAYGEIARPLRDFVDRGGSLGNAFVVAYPTGWITASSAPAPATSTGPTAWRRATTCRRPSRAMQGRRTLSIPRRQPW